MARPAGSAPSHCRCCCCRCRCRCCCCCGACGGHRPDSNPLGGHRPPSSTTTASNSVTVSFASAGSSSTTPLRPLPLRAERDTDTKLRGAGGDAASAAARHASAGIARSKGRGPSAGALLPPSTRPAPASPSAWRRAASRSAKQPLPLLPLLLRPAAAPQPSPLSQLPHIWPHEPRPIADNAAFPPNEALHTAATSVAVHASSPPSWRAAVAAVAAAAAAAPPLHAAPRSNTAPNTDDSNEVPNTDDDAPDISSQSANKGPSASRSSAALGTAPP
eukprot:250590-Chlamydomonas_euryale.AAC.1